MKAVKLGLTVLLFYTCTNLNAQSQTSNFWKPNPPNYQVKHAFEVESLVPLFLYGGYHIGFAYRYKQFRIRASVIDGGSYDIEKTGIDNASAQYKRYYKPGAGLFFGYNVWKHLEIYGYLEKHKFEIEEKISGEKNDIKSIDKGIGLSYQFFIGRQFYIQPGYHTYFRTDKSINFSNSTYNIPNIDHTFVVRLGVRLFS